MNLFSVRRRQLQAIPFDHKEMMVGRRDEDLGRNEHIAGMRLGDIQRRAAVQNLCEETFVIGRKVHHNGNGCRKIRRQASQNDGQSF